MKKKVVAAFSLMIIFSVVSSSCFYSPRYIFRVIAWQDADYDDFKKFKLKQIEKSKFPYFFFQGNSKLESEVIEKFEEDPSIVDFNAFMEEKKTHAFIVIRNDTVLYEKYFLNHDRTSLQTSFSVSKSILSLLVGIAIDQGFIEDINDSITKYIPELEKEDEEFSRISILNLLKMRSGISFSRDVNFPFVNADSPKTYYHPDLRRVAIKHSNIIGTPNGEFKYNSYNALLIGLILERSTKQSVASFMEKNLWQKVGTEFDASWSTDENNFEKMESGLNARPIDFAKIGKLMLDRGKWQENEIVKQAWVEQSTQPQKEYPLEQYSNPKFWTYNRFWWGVPEKDTKSDFMAIGRFGQFIYVSPRSNTIIVRHGEEIDSFNDFGWISIFQNFIEQ